MAFIEPCFGIGHNLSLICQVTSEDIKHQLIIITGSRGWLVWGGGGVEREKKEEEGGYDKDVSERERLGGGGRERERESKFYLAVYSHFW